MSDELLPPGTRVDRWAIEGMVGQGGSAVVYRARHLQLGSLHAIKVLLVTSPIIRQRLLQEGRLQASLHHTNIVAVTDVLEVGGAPALVMEYVDGIPLDLLLSRARLTTRQVDHLARGILAGVVRAHRHGLIHRDLKPANVLLARSELGPTPKVADFGMARVLGGDEPASARLTRSGSSIGTPSYMAPEQFRSARDVDQRADVWSLGAVLYELVTGRKAFDGPDFMAIFLDAADGRYVPPAELVPSMPARWAEAIAGALQADPVRRIPDSDTLRAIWEGDDLGRKRATIDWGSDGLLGAPGGPVEEPVAPEASAFGADWLTDPRMAGFARRPVDPTSIETTVVRGLGSLSGELVLPQPERAPTGWVVAAGAGALVLAMFFGAGLMLAAVALWWR